MQEKIPQYRLTTDRAEIINGILCRCQHTNNTCCEGTRAKSLSAFAFYSSFSPQQNFMPLRRTDKVLCCLTRFTCCLIFSAFLGPVSVHQFGPRLSICGLSERNSNTNWPLAVLADLFQRCLDISQ